MRMKKKNPNTWLVRPSYSSIEHGVKIAIVYGSVLVLVCAIVSMTEKMHPNGLSLVDEVRVGSYCPSLSDLCTREGKRGFKSYDEYYDYYYELLEGKQNENYDDSMGYQKVENKKPFYFLYGALGVYFVFSRSQFRKETYSS